MKTETAKFTVGKISLLPTTKALGIYKEDKLLLELSREDGMDLIGVVMDFVKTITSEETIKSVMKGIKKKKTSKHK